MTKIEVASLVEKYLADARLDDIYFVVDRERIQTGDNWYRVPIRPSYLPQKLFRLYEFLAEYEVEIADKEKINILLTSGEPLVEEPELVAA
jgi:hypothetical protein